MGFIFEQISQSDKNKYKLEDSVKYWSIDRERRLFIYGGGATNRFMQQVMEDIDFINDYVFFWDKIMSAIKFIYLKVKEQPIKQN